MNRFVARLTPHVVVTLACSALALCLPACDCAGNVGPGGDAGDTGPLTDGGPPRDSGPDTGVRPDGGPDTGTHPDAGACSNPESCNGMDDDCDGLTDENIAVSCGSDIGICRSGTQTCTAGMLNACSGGMMAAASDVCGNGLDDDCDESVDESCSCTNGATQSCGSGVGECRRGTQTCASSAWGPCVGEVTPTAELCDGLDNNCDGMNDETFPGLGGSCDGPDADMCTEGTLACSADHLSATCSDATGDNAEACNGTDDNCNGVTDEGCTCTDGATQACGTDTGACVAGVQTCASGTWGACAGSTGPASEICNTLDDNCNGMTDEGFALGVMCDGADGDFCNEGMTMCDATGGVVCGDVSATNVETCNAMDDNCDGVIDEGFSVGAMCDGPDADMCNEGTIACNASGGAMCNDGTGDSVEVCNNMDDDCDGNVDEGNPGGTTTMIGTCVSQTVCVGGLLVPRGTFVSATGAATGGTSSAPVGSITTAIANAVAIGGGADVCVCDPAGGAVSTFTENVTMVEGVSVLGGLDCTTWMPSGTSVTAVQDTDADGLTFPAAITVATALDHMTVIGFTDATAGATTSAITITDSSPTLATDTVRAGAAADAIGLRVVHAAATTSPTVTNGAYSATGVAGGTATAVSIEGASPHFTTVTINGASSGIAAATAATSYGVDCTACGGTTFMGGSVGGGSATTSATGFAGTGDLTGLTAMTTSFNGGSTSANGSTSAGVSLSSCMGAPAFSGVNATGGGNPPAMFPTMTTRTAFASAGATCAPVINQGRYIGCELGVTCIGIDASAGSPIVVTNVTPGPGGAPVGIQATTGNVDVGIGMRCRASSCATISGNQIAVGNLSRSGPTGVGLWIADSSPAVDNNRITGPSAQLSVAMAPLQLDGLLLQGATSSVVTNNVIHDGTHALRVFTVQYDMTPTTAGGARGPVVANNTIDYTPCTLCGPRVGLVLFSNAVTTPSGVFRNNIIRNAGAGGTTNPVIEANVNADPLVFQNNALFDATAMGGTLYLDESTTSLTTAAAINAIALPASVMYGANQVVDCMLNASFHIPMASACRDTGTAMSCPSRDFDTPASPRPTGAMCDIGADEFVP